MFDEIYADFELPAPDPARWQDQLKEIAHRSYRIMISHNDLARAALASVPTGPNAMRVSEAMFGLMLAGFPHLRGHAEVMTSGAPGERFQFGLDLLIDGLRRYCG
ncbi:TetR/AcrR family transcriptional regulator C-terminal domain-containing protein [Actinoplanes sp. GCM10030250]|uniref:TetR/AcrR family transcriptional regulator C-terminal domain-containing protein n=1 Tax=Actinoplanes sp. GCM10030250 TaxID=3273376 RepID=UPI003618F994